MENPSPTLPERKKTADFGALVRAARSERLLSENTLLAYQRAWRRLFAWAGMHKLDPVALTAEQAAKFYREMVSTDGRTAASSQVQARAALAFAYEHWDVANPFAKVKPPKSAPPPPLGYQQAHDLALPDLQAHPTHHVPAPVGLPNLFGSQYARCAHRA